jgi:EAL domain-containing protein (putative c-di-GMP-specific phosphodiesterase class I)/GGDEF domain-containing protein
MSLMRQVWLLVLGAVLASLLGSVAVSAHSVRQLLQTQLQLKNSDNAQALALALSQQRGDKELMSLLISAQFDTGYYQSVVWRLADGRAAFERHADPKASVAPAWFVALLPVQVTPGEAQVSDGWRALGSVEVLSQASYVHDEIWYSTLRSALLLAGIAALASLAALAVLRRLRRPVDDAVSQAHAVVEGRFEMVRESSVPELRPLTVAMNAMVQRVKHMFDAQAEQLRVLRVQAHCDVLTGLSERKHFLAELSSVLARDEGPLSAGLVLVRLRDLAGLNQRLGRPAVDQVLLAMAHALKAYPERVPDCLAGRLNGADFALWLPAPKVAEETAHALAEALRVSLPAFGGGIQVALGAVEMAREQPLSAWFGEADAALARAETQVGYVVEARAIADTGHLPQGERAWRAQILDALQQRRTRLLEYPVLGREGQVLHWECPLQLQLEPQAPFVPATRWLPLALRSRLTAEVDAQAMALALAACEGDSRMRCVNMAPASLLDGSFVPRLRELAIRSPQAARRLGLELPESAAISHFALLQELGRQLRPLGVQVGIEHAGPALSQLDRLYQLGLDYVKLDASVVVGVAGDAARAAYVRGMVIMLRSLSLRVYAEGIGEALDAQALWDCELDGITGPWASAQLS